MKQQPALPENNCERFCYAWMRLELWGVDQMGGMRVLVICGNIRSAEEINLPGWHQQNMWLTWANAAGDPFCTCLIGIPISDFTGFAKWVGARGKRYVGGNRSSVENHSCNTTRGGTKLDICKRLGIRPNSEGFQAGMITQSLNESRLVPR